MKNKIVLISGATGGIGKEFVKYFVKEDIDEIWAIARNEEKLIKLQTEFGKKIVPISMDLSLTTELKRMETLLSDKQPEICYLVNNAGLAKMAPSTEFTMKEIEDTINLNCKTPALLCNICVPYMKEGSHIINISSSASFQPTPYINLYAATKAFERSYSRALNVELRGKGICVTAVCPSWVDTPLLSKEINGIKVKFPGLVRPEEVVEKAMLDAKKGKDMSICSFYVKCQHLYVKLISQRLSMKIWTKGVRKYL